MKKKKIILSSCVLLLIILTLVISSASSADPGGPTEEKQRVFSQNFSAGVNPLEVEVISWPSYQPGQEILIICRVKNHSPLIEEVIYDLKSDQGLGGTGAVIDYDGPFGPKVPEVYNWNKVPVYPGQEQYLYVSFPPPAVYEKEFVFTLTVDRWLGPRG